MIDGSVGEWIPLQEAAEKLNINIDTVRRRVKKGELQGRKQPTLRGYRWEVYLDSAYAPAQPLTQSLGRDLQHNLDRLISLVEKLTEQHKELTEDNHQLAQQNTVLAGQVGFLQGQLEATKQEILLLKAPLASEPEQQPSLPHPWWQFWRKS